MSAATIFDIDISTSYRCTLRVRELMTGGIPGDPSVIRKWLETRMELDDTALNELLAQTIAERDAPMTATEKVDVLMASDTAPSVNGFKRHPDTGELCYEGRCMKAALKEAMNSAYPGTNWDGKKDHPVTKDLKKGLMRYAAEAVHVDDHLIGLGVKEPSWVEERIKHVLTPRGPISSISRVEVVQRPELTFTVRVRDDFLNRTVWGRVWSALEEIGIGADRGRSDGKFELLAFDKV